MAVTLEHPGTLSRFIGLSGDAKPTNTFSAGKPVDFQAGSTFYEADTGKVFRWTGEVWMYADASEVMVGLLRTISGQLERIELTLSTGLNVKV